VYTGQLRAVATHFKVSLDTPWKQLPAKARRAVLYGAGDAELKFRYKSKTGRFDYQGVYEGVIPNLERRFRDSESTRCASGSPPTCARAPAAPAPARGSSPRRWR